MEGAVVGCSVGEGVVEEDCWPQENNPNSRNGQIKRLLFMDLIIEEKGGLVKVLAIAKDY